MYKVLSEHRGSLEGRKVEALNKLLKLLARSFAIKKFCEPKVVAHVKLVMDNTSAVLP